VFQLKLNADDRAKAEDVMSKLVTRMMDGQEPQSFELGGGTFYSPMIPPGPLLAGVGKDRFMVVYDKDFDSAKARVESVANNVGKGFSNTDAWKGLSKHLLFGSATQSAREGTLSRNHTIIFLGISK
jgi:hypothetical protein